MPNQKSESQERAEAALLLRMAQRRIIEEAERAIGNIEYFLRESRRTLERCASDPDAVGFGGELEIVKLPGALARDMIAGVSNANGNLDAAAAAARDLSAQRAKLGALPPAAWSFTKSDPGLSGLPAFWTERAGQSWAIAINYEEDCVGMLCFYDGATLSERQIQMKGAWTMTALKKAIDERCRDNDLPELPAALLADFFMSEGW